MNCKAIYFDHAATGFPKPDVVLKKTIQAFTELGGNPGRSGHKLSVRAAAEIFKCREKVCDLINFNRPERVVFTQNATHALNIAIQGLCNDNCHIVISNLEHNSVIRPVNALSSIPEKNITYSFFDASSENEDVVIGNFMSELRDNTMLVIVTAVSNICGKILPVKRISNICNARGIKLIVDVSQALGEINFNFSDINPSVICCAGHKGLYGPTGTGFAVFSEAIEPSCIMQGGNGIMSEIPEMTGELPERLEVGTLNTFGICGLGAGIDFVSKMGIEENAKRLCKIAEYITENLYDMNLTIYGDYKNKTPIILFNVPNKSCYEVSGILDEINICTRSGLHCSPTAHKALATGDYGAVRVSLGYSNTMAEASRFIYELSRIIKK